MRVWIESLNTALNWSIGIALGVLALMWIIAELRSGLPTWRESHRQVRRKTRHEDCPCSDYDNDNLIAYPADPANGEDHRG